MPLKLTGSCTILLITICLFSCNRNNQRQQHFFRYNEVTGVASLDPAFAKNQSVMWVVHQLYSTLVENDEQLQTKPLLAKSWEVSADRKEYIFHLRNDVWFHDNDAFPNGKGRKMTAADVVYSLGRLMDKQTASSGAWIFNNRVDTTAAFTATDDSTFRLRLIRPFNPILGLLSMQYCSIVPREVVEKYGKDFRSHPCGTGPFELLAWEEGQAMVLKKNAAYFEKDAEGRSLPYLDGIKISFYDSRATEFLLFQQGEIDFINDIDPSFKDEVITRAGELRKEWRDKIVLNKHAYLNTEYLGILVDSNNLLVKQSPLRLKKIRQAINYGFDRRKMMLYLRNSIGMPAESGFIPAGFPCFDSATVKGYRYDIAKARRLVAEAGFGPGHPFPPVKLLTIPIYADFASFIAKELEDAGIRAEVEVLQKSLLLEETAKSQALFFRGSWIADYPDAENYLSVFFSGNPAPPNYTRYHNARFDALYERALVEENDSVKQDLYRQMDRLIIEDAPVVPLWYDEVFRLVSPRIQGFFPNSLNLLELRTTQVR